jgi:L-cysteine/cystine lyase
MPSRFDSVIDEFARRADNRDRVAGRAERPARTSLPSRSSRVMETIGEMRSGQDDEQMLRQARERFPILERVAYLNAGSAGPLAAATVAEMTRYDQVDLERGRSGSAYWEEAMALRSTVRGQLAACLGVGPDHLALTSSTGEGCRIAITGLDLRPDDEVVTTDCEHPALLGPLRASGARVRIARVGQRPAADAEDAIGAEITPRTRLIALSHVVWTTGQRLPIHEIKTRFELPVLVDGAQAVGAIPLSMGSIDFYTVSGQKWLCGPDAIGALYVADASRLRVGLPSIFSYADQLSFELMETASRFDSGWQPRSSLAGLRAALEHRPSWALGRAEEMADRCRAALIAADLRVRTEAGQGTLVAFEARGNPSAAVGAAAEAGVVIRDLPGTGWLRASCGYWTSDEDIERLVEVVSRTH